jgi:hypothetical protein
LAATLTQHTKVRQGSRERDWMYTADRSRRRNEKMIKSH